MFPNLLLSHFQGLKNSINRRRKAGIHGLVKEISLSPVLPLLKRAVIRFCGSAKKTFTREAKTILRLTFIAGPKVLFTSRISGKCAALMVMMCSPSLVFFSVLTIPPILFQSPQQNAYFYFAGILNQDPSRWLVLLLAAICTVLSLAIPATMPTPPSSVSHY